MYNMQHTMHDYNYGFLIDGAVPAGIVRRLLNIQALKFNIDLTLKGRSSYAKVLQARALEQSLRNYAAMTGAAVRERVILAPGQWDEEKAVARELRGGYASPDSRHIRWRCIQARLAELKVKSTEEAETCLYGLLIKYVYRHWASWKLGDEAILDMHSRLFQAAVIAGRTPAALGEYRSPAGETEIELRRAVAAYSAAAENVGENALLLAICFIKDYWAIQPFPDGNGRMARLLLRLLLLQCGINVWQYVSLEKTVHDQGNRYRDELVLSAQKGYWDFAGVFLSMLHSAYIRLNQIREERPPLKGSKTQRVKDFVMQAANPVSKAEICAGLPDISVTMVEKVLGDMVRDRSVLIHRRGRSTEYVGIPAQA